MRVVTNADTFGDLDLVRNLNVGRDLTGVPSGMTETTLSILKVRSIPDPKYMTEGAAGFDLVAALDMYLVLAPGERRLIPSGIVVVIPEGYEGQVRSRSGTTLNKGLVVANSPGTIDSDYRGEVGVIIHNIGSENVTIEPLERIAQMVVCPVVRVKFEVTAKLSSTARGTSGFGSSGVLALIT